MSKTPYIVGGAIIFGLISFLVYWLTLEPWFAVVMGLIVATLVAYLDWERNKGTNVGH